MGVGFITGRMGTARTEKMLDLCFKEAEKDSTKPIYILVPEKYTYEMEKKVSERFKTDKDPNLRIRVVSFSTLSNLVFTRVGGVKERKISPSARNMIVYSAIESSSKDLATLSISHSNVGIVTRLLDMIIELKQNNMSVDSIYDISGKVENEYLSLKLNDIAKIYGEYENILSREYIDSEDSIELFSEKLEDFRDIKGATIFVDEFTGFTPVQYKVIEKLIVLSENIYFTLLTDLRNFNAATGVFSKTNITFMNINRICVRNGVKRIEDFYLKDNEDYISEAIGTVEERIASFNPEKSSLKPDGIEIHEFSDNHRELDFAANEIMKLVKEDGYRFSEITVAMRNMDSYSHIIKSIFSKYGIGYFLDEKIKSKDNPIIVVLMSILNMKNENYSYKSMFRYFKSGFSPLSDHETSLLENYVIANGIKGKKWFSKWERTVKHSPDDDDGEEEVKVINEIRERAVKPILALHEKLKGRNRVKDICRYLYEFTKDIELDRQIYEMIEDFKEKEKNYLAKEYSQVWNIYIDMLDEMVEFMGEKYMGISRFLKFMEIEFEGIELGIIPPSRDEVFVTSVERMKNPDTRALFILGVNDGVFPAAATDDSMLSGDEKRKLLEIGVKFDTDDMTRSFDEEFLVYKAMSTARERLYLSYPRKNFDNEELKPSILVKRLKKIFPDISVRRDEKPDMENIYSKEGLFREVYRGLKEYCEDEKNCGEYADRLKAVYRYLLKDEEYRRKMEISNRALEYVNTAEPVDKKIAELMYDENYLSVSKLERYSYCPFSYFISYGLKARERKEFMFSNMDSGIYTHKILDDFSKKMAGDQIKWDDIDRRYIENEVEILGNESVGRKEEHILNSSAKNRNILQRINRILVDSINIIAHQIKDSLYEPEFFELEFNKNASLPSISYRLKNGKKINLIGKIDRVDTYFDPVKNSEFVRVIDYKSSSHDLDLNRILAGIQLQLFIYMRAVLNSNERFRPAALLYSRIASPVYKINNPEEVLDIGGEKVQGEILKQNRMSGFVIKDLDILKSMDNTVASKGGSSKYVPMNISGKGDKMKVGAYTKGINEEEFNVVNSFVLKKSKEICENIYEGKIDIKPYKYENEKPCDYCKFRSICQFDISLEGNEYNYIVKRDMKKESDRIFRDMKKLIEKDEKEE